MKPTAEILRLLRDVQPELERQFGVKRLAIFGSYARGEQREDSDVVVPSLLRRARRGPRSDLYIGTAVHEQGKGVTTTLCVRGRNPRPHQGRIRG